jgi:hypothetical protein
MNNILMNQNNEDDFQFYKENLKSNVKEYLEIDDYIKALNKALKEKRNQKKKLQENILESMQKFEIDNMNTKNGKLVYSKTTAKKGLNKQNLLSGLLLYFQNNEDNAKDACTLIMENRPKVEKISLKRTINKAPVN